MDDYISREEVMSVIANMQVEHHYDAANLEDRYVVAHLLEVADRIKELKAADVQSVRHGRWIETHISLCKWVPEDEKEEGHSFYMAELKCSCCERYNTVTFALSLTKPDFCQLCGARMDLKDGDTDA